MRGTINADSITNWPGRYETGPQWRHEDETTYGPTDGTELSDSVWARCTEVDGDLCEMDVFFGDESSERYLVARFTLDTGMRPVDRMVLIEIVAKDMETVLHSQLHDMDPWHVCNLDELHDTIVAR